MKLVLQKNSILTNSCYKECKFYLKLKLLVKTDWWLIGYNYRTHYEKKATDCKVKGNLLVISNGIDIDTTTLPTTIKNWSLFVREEATREGVGNLVKHGCHLNHSSLVHGCEMTRWRYTLKPLLDEKFYRVWLLLLDGM